MVKIEDVADVDDFLSEVDKVSSLVDGLAKGRIDASYVERVERAEQREKDEQKQKQKQKEAEDEAKKFDNLPPEKQAELRERVAGWMEERKQREEGRARFAEYREKHPQGDARLCTTDYTAWDLWTQSDDEEDPWHAVPPDSPAFKAMEKDMNERHERDWEKRRAAYRCRETGNVAYKAGQYAEALKNYEAGLAAEKRSIELHTNAAQAALKLGCYVQVLEHCDAALQLAEFILTKPDHPLAIKAYVRRAAARRQLDHTTEAVADLTEANRLDPGNKEVQRLLKEAKEAHRVRKHEKAVARQAQSAGEDDAGAAGEQGSGLRELRRVEELAKTVAANEEGVDAAAAEMESLLERSEDCRVYLRTCGGLAALAKVPRSASVQRALAAAAADPQNAAVVSEAPGCLSALAAEVASAPSAVVALSACTHAPAPRAKVAAAIAADAGALPSLSAAVATGGADGAHALGLLANTALEAPVRTALVADPAVLTATVGALRDNLMRERAASLLGNLCSEAKVRSALAADTVALSSLLSILPASAGTAPAEASSSVAGGLLPLKGKKKAPAPAPSVSAGTKGALAALANVLLEPAAAEAVVHVGGVPRFVAVLGCGNPVAAARAATSLARLAKVEGGAAAALSAEAMQPLVALAQGDDADAAEASIRAIATAVATHPPSVAALADAGGLSALVGVVAAKGSSEAAIGNAALTIANVAKDAQWHAQLHKLDAVAPLTEVAHKRTGATQKNAAIAMARMAVHPPSLERLRELHAIEIIAQYVRP